jgi:hypothetical protein
MSTTDVSNSIEIDSKLVNNASGEKRSKIELIGDHSNGKLTILHYMGISVWLGWFSFYAYLPITLALLWWYCKPVFALFIAAFITAHFLPIDRELQPDVTFYFVLWFVSYNF